MKNKTVEILCAGFGGQGIMFMGKLLAQAGLIGGKQVTWMPSYGAEVRGGTAYSMTKISECGIANPLVTAPDVLVVMNKPSLLKYESKLKPGGLLISNKTLVGDLPKKKGVKSVNIPMTDIALRLGDVKVANMIAIGALIKRINILSVRNASNALAYMLKDKEKLLVLNKSALEKGYKW